MRAFTLILIAATVFGVAAHAQQTAPERKRDEIPPLQPGMIYLVPPFERLATVSVGNPVVADASVVPAPNGRARVLVVGKTSGETGLVAFDRDGNVLYDAIVIVRVAPEARRPPPPRPPLGTVAVHTRRILQYYWPYHCVDTGCWRVGDPFAGPPPGQLQQRIEYTPLEEEAAPVAPTAPQPPR
jgi:putative type II/III system pilus formation protein